MSSNKNEIIENALAGGVIGAALGALLTGKSKGALASAIVGAAIGASIKALREARKTNIPVLYEDNRVIYRLYPNGDREFVKNLEKQEIEIPQKFSLE